GKNKNGSCLVGFAAESENVVKNAKQKLIDKNLDLIIANDISTFDSDQIKFSIIDKSGEVADFPEQAKSQAAQVILDRVVELF
ncbi:MAG: phosphopantothenoylcysteine decarboxylase, partial [bacterium]